MSITILLPLRDSYMQLKETLHSLVRQSYKKWELLVLDHQSIDGSLSLVNSLGKKQNIHLFECKSNNFFQNLNLGISKVSCSSVLVLEAGDRFKFSTSLEKISTSAHSSDLLGLAFEMSSNKKTVFSNFSKIKKLSLIAYQDRPLCSLVFSTPSLQKYPFDESLKFLSHEKIVRQMVLTPSEKKISELSDVEIIRDAGNTSYLHQYDYLKMKEYRKILKDNYGDSL